jgi:hypothetical protein
MNNTPEESQTMRKLKTVIVAVAAGAMLTTAVHGQDTNFCPMCVMTRLEAAQTNIGRITIKATTTVGSISARGGVLAVNCMEVKDVSTGHQEYGIAISVTDGDQSADIALIDYEELDSLLGALDYINRVDWSVTALAGFDAFYTTKDGFRMAAFSSKRNGTIEFAVRTLRYNLRPILFARDQVAQFRGLIQQAKGKLDSIQPGK